MKIGTSEVAAARASEEVRQDQSMQIDPKRALDKTSGPRITIFGALFATFAIGVGIWLSLTLPLVLMTLVPIAIFYSVIRRSFDDYKSNAASLCIKATLFAIATNIAAGLLIVFLA